MSVISDVAQYLDDQSIGTLGTDLFYSYIPDNSTAPVIMVRDTGGPEPDQYIGDIKTPTFQVFIRSADYATGKDLLQQIRDLLHPTYNTYLVGGGVYFRRIHAQSEGGHIGRNEAGMDEFSINFIASVVEP